MCLLLFPSSKGSRLTDIFFQYSSSMTLNSEKHADRNPRQSGYIGSSIIGEGKYKIVSKEHTKKVVDKFLKSGVTFSSESFLEDVQASEAALPYVTGFVKYVDEQTQFRGRVTIKLNIASTRWRTPRV